jgi:hypothetical protein
LRLSLSRRSRSSWGSARGAAPSSTPTFRNVCGSPVDAGSISLTESRRPARLRRRSLRSPSRSRPATTTSIFSSSFAATGGSSGRHRDRLGVTK